MGQMGQKGQEITNYRYFLFLPIEKKKKQNLPVGKLFKVASFVPFRPISAHFGPHSKKISLR